MSLPQVAIVGRPNVGKSSLFNWLAGRRIAIVDPTPGVTRDRLVAPVHVGERWFELVDTGGMGVQDADQLTADVERQIAHAIDKAAVIVFLVDVRAGVTPLDVHVAEKLRGVGKPVLLAANKCDTEAFEHQIAEFHRLGMGDVLPVSALQNRGKGDLIEALVERLPEETADNQAQVAADLKVAIVGRRNTGKSTFINSMAGEERTIVSEVEGTTRDSVDVRYERDGKAIIAIDTAGVRYKGKVKTDVDFYSLARAERSIRRADVVLHFFDAEKKVSLVDKQLAGSILEQHKPAVFVVNKWDLAGDLATETYGDYLRQVFPSLDFVPIAFITAKTGRNVQRVMDLARALHKQAGQRVGTGELNRVLRMAVEHQALPLRKNRTPRIYFGTQVSVQPPTLVLFTNGPELIDLTYQRYLMKTFRDHLPFTDVPIKMYLRHRSRAEPGEAKEGKAVTKVPPRTRSKKKQVGELWQDV